MDNTKILIMLVGLPRSGKSTEANSMSHPIVCPDAIRAALHGQAFSAAAEPMVWTIARYMVESLFLAGHKYVTLDACNVVKANRDEWKSPKWVRQFVKIDTPLHVCQDRAIEAGQTYLLSVIEEMYRKSQGLWHEEIIEYENYLDTIR